MGWLFFPHDTSCLCASGRILVLPNREFPNADQRITDLHFADLMQDTIGAINQVYQQLDMPFTRDAAAAIQAYMRARPRGKHGSHKYAYADAVNIEREKQRFSNYMKHYGVRAES